MANVEALPSGGERNLVDHTTKFLCSEAPLGVLVRHKRHPPPKVDGNAGRALEPPRQRGDGGGGCSSLPICRLLGLSTGK